MGRPKTPTNILEMRGAFKKNPKRRRPGEPKPTKPLGNPPGRLGPDVKKAWREIDRHCVPGVLTAMDRVTLELLATALARIRENIHKTDPDGKFLVTMADLKSALTMLGKFGMSPADRRSAIFSK